MQVGNKLFVNYIITPNKRKWILLVYDKRLSIKTPK
jgi:hypothetical protein